MNEYETITTGQLRTLINKKLSAIYDEIDDISSSDDPDLLEDPMTEIELLEFKIETIEELYIDILASIDIFKE